MMMMIKLAGMITMCICHYSDDFDVDLVQRLYDER